MGSRSECGLVYGIDRGGERGTLSHLGTLGENAANRWDFIQKRGCNRL